MELLRRTTLYYREGTSDKVYEVDVCCTGQDRYVVNFRYGRRGATLKEGTKTTQAVSLAEAERIFTQLVREKTHKGYRDIANQPPVNTTPVSRETVTVTSSDPRHQAILTRLANRDGNKWTLERVIWRAGELKIPEATPLLIPLIGTGAPLRDYCIAWALGWCGGKGATPALIRLYQNASSPDFVSRIAFEALLKLADPETKASLQAEAIAFLPSDLQELARNGTAEAFTATLRDYLNSNDYRRFAVLDTIYKIDNQYVRPALLDILRNASLKPNYFKPIRHIFKMAEYRHDAEVFGILTYAFEKQSGNYNSDRYYISLPDGSYLTTSGYASSNITPLSEEIKRPNARVAYSNQTRDYLRRRVWRTLKQLGEAGDSEYTKMALSILLKYSDADAQIARESVVYRWNYSSNWTRVEHRRSNWDAYAGYLTLNHLLYENSPRYLPHLKAWQCQNGYKSGDPEPNVREEAFPELWQRHPEALLQLLLESGCRPIHHFAVKAIRSCKEFCDRLPIDIIIQLLNKPYEVTAELGFSLAVTRYNPAEPNSALVLVLVNCTSQNARNQAYQWIEAQRQFFFASSDFIASLITSHQADTRTFARRLLSSSILDDATARVLIGRIIAALLVLSVDPPQPSLERGEIEALASEIGETLLLSFTPQLRNLGLSVINDLLQHPMPEVQTIGARILLNHEIRAIDLPPDLIESLLASPYESVRGIGVRIFGQLPDEKLLRDYNLILAIAVNAVADIRNAIRPVIQRLANHNSEFAEAIAFELIDVLLTPERHAGVHKDVVQLLREDLPNWMFVITKDKTIQLIRAKSSLVQELGGLVLQKNQERFFPEFQTSEIVKLANHEILAIREAARQIFILKLPNIRSNSEEMLAAVRLLEAKWDDSREFATGIFSTEFTVTDWTPEVMTSICDSVREDVRQFGRDIVSRYFQTDYGQEYLLKFSEHPSSDMQMFATNYLETYAIDNCDRLRELSPYFISVLCSVNRGRVAKKRILNFLETEAQKSEQAAQIVAEILTRQSITMAIGDKAAAIQTMLKIHKTYPHISLPLQLKPVVAVRR
jgi:predicted DNA-binding WGR domain protein